MSFPVIPLLLGGVLLAALAGGSKSKSAAGAPGASLQPGSGKYDSPGGAVMPLTLEQTVDRELADDSNPANLLQLAASLSPMYPKAVAALKARAAQLQASGTATSQPAPAPLPVVIPPPVSAPVVPPSAGPSPTPGPAPVGTIGDGTGVITLPVQTIVGDPNGQAPVAPWDPSYAESISASIPGSYKQQSAETKAVQGALNAWAVAVGYDGPTLTVDGLYGPHTAQAAADFQDWVNQTQGGSLQIDGLAGPETQSYLSAFGDMVSGPY